MIYSEGGDSGAEDHNIVEGETPRRKTLDLAIFGRFLTAPTRTSPYVECIIWCRWGDVMLKFLE